MPGEFITQATGEKEISFKQIVLEHQRRILKIASHEFTKTDHTKIYPSYTEYYKGTDNALNYIQSVEAFASLLHPFFDEEITKEYGVLIKYFDCWIWEFEETGKELIKKYTDKNSKPDIKKLAELLRKQKIIDAKKLFLELNKLLMRKDYLKGTIYEETDPEVLELKEDID